MTHEVALQGCAPTPLAHYLKALAVLRLVAEQVDPEAAGWWHGKHFVLRSTLDREGIERFFLETYRPTPVVAPWNGGSGFYPRDNRDASGALADTEAGRFADYREAVRFAQALVAETSPEGSPSGEDKHRLLARMRSEAPGALLPWLDAAYLLGEDKPHYPPLLGTGGNDGRLDFTNNLMQRLVELFETETGRATSPARAWLPGCLWGEPTPQLVSKAVGQFLPGGVGGPNATTGFDASSLVNPWDFVLAIEGALLFAGAASRRLSGGGRALSYPFTVRPSGGGSGATTPADEGLARAEIWLPLWPRPAGLSEVRALFAEGRATVGRRAAVDGLDFARAVAGLGIDRGVRAFQRYSFLKRSGLSYLASPLTLQPVRRCVETDLITDLDRSAFLDRLRQYARGDNTPVAIQQRVRHLEGLLFQLAGQPSRAVLQAVLETLGQIQHVVGRTARSREAVPPVPLLSQDWVLKADDATPEFRMAAALAGLGASDLPMSCHFTPATLKGGRRGWPEASQGDLVRGCVWSSGSLVENLGRVAARRALLTQRADLGDIPLHFACAVEEGEVALLLAGRIDEPRLALLLAGLVLARVPRHVGEPRAATALPAAYAVLKPFFVPEGLLRSVSVLEEGAHLRRQRRVVALLQADRTEEAVRLAWQRLRVAGVALPPHPRPPPASAGMRGPRLLAALLVPLTPRAMARQVHRLLEPQDRRGPDPTSPSRAQGATA